MSIPDLLVRAIFPDSRRWGKTVPAPARAALVLGLLCAWPGAEGWAAPPFHGSLFTPVSQNSAIGPPHTAPVAYYPYEPRELKAWRDVASGVRQSVAAHLTERLGKDFYARMKFAGGEAVNLDELHRALPASKRFRREVPTYLLWFEFGQPDDGIRVYTASIELRRDGSVIREIDLPPFAAEPDKLRIKPLAEVSAELISKRVIDAEATTVNLAYDDKHALILWHFEQALPGRSAVVKVKNIDVNAHTGAVLRRYVNHGR